MRKTLFLLVLLCTSLMKVSAQEIKVGCFSYKAVLQSMPAYYVVNGDMEKLRKQYTDELNAAQSEFNEKYEIFLEQMDGMAESIRQKRQSDLQTLLERNEQFRKESERLLVQAENEAMSPLHDKLKAAISQLGEQGGYLLILNTDSEACPYIAPSISEDVTEKLIELAK